MRCFAVLIAVGFAAVVCIPSSHAGQTFRVSVASGGGAGNFYSEAPSISANGRYVAFISPATNLVPGDTNDYWDVFVHDRQTRQTGRVSVSSAGGQANDSSWAPFISADGRYVAFESPASNLVGGDTNGYWDIFVHDRQTGQTTRVSVSSAGGQANGDSRYGCSISADGRYVAFMSGASNLVGGDTNGWGDVFVHDRQTGQTTRVSVASDGGPNGNSLEPSISAGGRYVAFESGANNLVPDDTNGDWDVFVHDRQTGQTTRVSVASGGGQSNGGDSPSISAGGRYVAFESSAGNLVGGDTNGALDVFVHDRQTGQTTRVSVATSGAQGNSDTGWPSISADGRYVAFMSNANNLVPGDVSTPSGDSDVFVHDRQTGQTRRVSVSSAGGQANSWSVDASISADGQHVAFQSRATNLVPDVVTFDNVFVRQRWTGEQLRPDLWVRAGTWIGDNIYNTTGEGQEAAKNVNPGKTVIYQLQVQNDGEAADQFLIEGKGGSGEWQVRYFNAASGGNDITGKVRGTGWLTPSLAPQAAQRFRMEVTASGAVQAGAKIKRLVSAMSWGDERKQDAAKTVTTVSTGGSGVAVTALTALPTAQGAQIVFSLSDVADVDARILNIAGRPIRSLCSARPSESGSNTLLWDARSDSGLPVPAGAYLVEVTARTKDGAQTRALAPLRLTSF